MTTKIETNIQHDYVWLTITTDDDEVVIAITRDDALEFADQLPELAMLFTGFDEDGPRGAAELINMWREHKAARQHRDTGGTGVQG